MVAREHTATPFEQVESAPVALEIVRSNILSLCCHVLSVKRTIRCTAVYQRQLCDAGCSRPSAPASEAARGWYQLLESKQPHKHPSPRLRVNLPSVTLLERVHVAVSYNVDRHLVRSVLLSSVQWNTGMLKASASLKNANAPISCQLAENLRHFLNGQTAAATSREYKLQVQLPLRCSPGSSKTGTGTHSTLQ
jgi:hypothetical protein